MLDGLKRGTCKPGHQSVKAEEKRGWRRRYSQQRQQHVERRFGVCMPPFSSRVGYHSRVSALAIYLSAALCAPVDVSKERGAGIAGRLPPKSGWNAETRRSRTRPAAGKHRGEQRGIEGGQKVARCVGTVRGDRAYATWRGMRRAREAPLLKERVSRVATRDIAADHTKIAVADFTPNRVDEIASETDGTRGIMRNCCHVSPHLRVLASFVGQHRQLAVKVCQIRPSAMASQQ